MAVVEGVVQFLYTKRAQLLACDVAAQQIRSYFSGESRCLVRGNKGAKGNSLTQQPKPVIYYPTLPHCPLKYSLNKN